MKLVSEVIRILANMQVRIENYITFVYAEKREFFFVDASLHGISLYLYVVERYIPLFEYWFKNFKKKSSCSSVLILLLRLISSLILPRALFLHSTPGKVLGNLVGLKLFRAKLCPSLRHSLR